MSLERSQVAECLDSDMNGIIIITIIAFSWPWRFAGFRACAL